MKDTPDVISRPIVGIPAASLESDGVLGGRACLVNQSFVRVLEEEGAVPIVLPLVREEQTLRVMYGKIDGLLLAGGVDIDPSYFGEAPHPKLGKVDAQRDWMELLVTPWALSEGMPILGICRGIQVLSVAAGGNIWQDIAAQKSGAMEHLYATTSANKIAHKVSIVPGSRLSDMFPSGELSVNSFHHQAVKDVGGGLTVTAVAPDGIIEAVEKQGKSWVIGVQWHPEWLLDDNPAMRRLFKEFVRFCGQYQDRRREQN